MLAWELLLAGLLVGSGQLGLLGRCLGWHFLSLLLAGHLLKEAEMNKKLTKRLALMDEFKSLPANAVWDYLCMTEGKGVGSSWLDEMEVYEREVQLKRD
ncbi:L-rhamnose isomerase [Vibrio parahaemolyticus]